MKNSNNMKNILRRSDYTYVLKWAKKIKAIDALGGRCKACGTTDIFVLEFHHINGKKDSWKHAMSVLTHGRWSTILSEIEKCDLYCRNCHTEMHRGEDSNYSIIRSRQLKKKLLEYKKTYCCEGCGFNGGSDFRALDFHHKEGELKEYPISEEANKHHDLVSHVKEELDKCIVLCKNCHVKTYINYDNFNRLKSNIYYKVNNHKELQSVDKDQVLKMYKSGMKQIEIARELGCTKSAVCYLVKKYAV